MARIMKCEICGEAAVFRFSPDMDIDGLGACGIHRREVQIAYLVLCLNGKEDYDKILGDLRRKPGILPAGKDTGE